MLWEGERPSGPSGETKVYKLLKSIPFIGSVFRAQHGDGMDRRGIDMKAVIEEGEAKALGSVNIQVKSSAAEVEKYTKKKGGKTALLKRKIIVLNATDSEEAIVRDFQSGLEEIRKAKNTEG